MNPISGNRPLDLGLTGGTWARAPAASGAGGAVRWLEGLTPGDSAPLTADVPATSQGLSAAEHADRVLSALLGDERA